MRKGRSASPACPAALVYSRVPVAADPSPVRAELDRVGASLRKAGTGDYISVQLGLDEVELLAPPREQPRRSWLGPEWQLLELLAGLPDDDLLLPADFCAHRMLAESPWRSPDARTT